jgi:hypothetical protein
MRVWPRFLLTQTSNNLTFASLKFMEKSHGASGDFSKAIIDELASKTHAEALAPEASVVCQHLDFFRKIIDIPEHLPPGKQVNGYSRALAAAIHSLQEDKKKLSRTLCSRLSLGSRYSAALWGTTMQVQFGYGIFFRRCGLDSAVSTRAELQFSCWRLP